MNQISSCATTHTRWYLPKALESLGVNWGKTLPIPNFDARQWPEVKKLMDQGVHLQQHHFRMDGSEMAAVFQGNSPANDGSTLEVTEDPPEGFPIQDLPERVEEFSPGLTPEAAAVMGGSRRTQREPAGRRDMPRSKKFRAARE